MESHFARLAVLPTAELLPVPLLWAHREAPQTICQLSIWLFPLPISIS